MREKTEAGTLVDALTMLMEKLLAPPCQANDIPFRIVIHEGVMNALLFSSNICTHTHTNLWKSNGLLCTMRAHACFAKYIPNGTYIKFN